MPVCRRSTVTFSPSFTARLGRHYLAVGALHMLFDALSIALLYDVCRRLFPRPSQQGDSIGALAGLFFALYPYLIFQNLTLNDTALWILLLHLFLWLLIQLRERATLDRVTLTLAIAAGLTLGVSVLARALLSPLAILVALWFLLKLTARDTLLRLLPVALVSLLVPLPWLIRSYQALRRLRAHRPQQRGEHLTRATTLTRPPYSAPATMRNG